jgi:FkbM family methyltransferase
MGNHRAKLRERFEEILDQCAQGENVELNLLVCSRECKLLMRKGNIADYLIGGEVIWGAYSPPRISPSLIIDGGANIGMFSMIAHAFFPDTPIVCYEPDASNLVQLASNLKANGISAKIVPKALWSKETTLFYHVGESYTGYVNEVRSDFPIECTVAEVSEGSWLKLDIEGAEYEALPEVLSRGVRPAMISMEIHSNHVSGKTLVDSLEASGYKLRKLHDLKAHCTNVEADFSGKSVTMHQNQK